MDVTDEQVESGALDHVTFSPRMGGSPLTRLRDTVKRHWPVVISILVSCFVFREWLLPDVFIAGADFPSFPESILRGGALGWPHLWTDLYFGLSETYWVGCMPLWALASPLEAAGAPFALIERLLWLWPYMLGAPLCGYYLCYRFTRNAAASALGAILFSINTFTIGLVERGHIPSLDAFMLFGLIIPKIIDATSRPNARTALTLALLVSAQIMYDLRYAYESILLLLFLTVLALPRLTRENRLADLVRGGVAFAAAMLALNLDLILPLALSPSSPPGWGSSSAFLSISHYGSLLSAFGMFYPFYHWLIGRDGFTQNSVEVPFIIVGAFAWFGLLIHVRRRVARALLAIGMLGIVLASETNSPFGTLNFLLYQHVPGFSMFRDYTKFFAIIVPAYSVGVALASVAISAVLRARLHSFRNATSVIAMLAACIYVVVMRDALNPLRRSNFGAAVPISAAGQKTDQYLREHLGDARVLMFPGDTRWQRRDQFIPIIDAGVLASSAPPLGFGLLNPGLAQPSAEFDWLSSPLAPALLSEMRVKYVVVPDDANLYFAFDGRPARWASIDFLRHQPWLHEVASFGENVVFETLQPPGDRAFFAAYPALVMGSPATLEGLVGSRLWSNRAAALAYSQMPTDASWLATIPNVVQGPTLIDPDFPIGSGGTSGEFQRLREANDRIRYGGAPYLARVFSSAMLTKTYANWNIGSRFAFDFQVDSPTTVQTSLLLERRKEIPSVVARTARLVDATSSGGQSAAESPVFCSGGDVLEGSFNGPPGGIELSGADVDRQIFVNNPCPTIYEGDIAFRATSGDSLPLDVSIAYASSATLRRFTAPPDWLSPFDNSATITLSHVVVLPGLNAIQVNKAAGRPLLIATPYTVSSLHALDEAPPTAPLKLTLRHSEAGNLIFASIDVPLPGLHVGYADLFGTLRLPLDQHPVSTLKYTLSDVGASFALVVDLRERTTGKSLSIWVPLTKTENRDWDIYAIVQTALQQQYARDFRYHGDDPLWIEQHFSAGPPRADQYTLRRLRIAATWSVVNANDVPRMTFVGVIGGMRLAITSRVIADYWTSPETTRVSLNGVSDHNFALRGMKVLRRETAIGPEPRIAALLSDVSPSSVHLDISLHVGDYVRLTLQNDKHVQGTIVAESSEYVLLQDGDNPPQRIARGSIATVTQLTLARSASLSIPIRAPFTPTNLTFDVRNDERLSVRLSLTYEAPDGARTTVAAVDRELVEGNGADRDAEFRKVGVPDADAVFDVAAPVDLSLSEVPRQRFSAYDLDLWSIEQYNFGSAKRKLVAVTAEFRQLPEVDTSDNQFPVTVSNVKLSRDRTAGLDTVKALAGTSLVTLDAVRLDAQNISPAPDGAQYLLGRGKPMALAPANHIIESQPVDAALVRAVTLSAGVPTRFQGGQVEAFDTVTPSEVAGTFKGNGLLVVSRAYDGGWSLATWSSSASYPALTGVALFDWVRSIGHMLPRASHVAVNTNIDAWYVAPSEVGEQRFTMLYVPEALNELGFVLTVAIAGIIVILRGKRRWFR